MERKEEDPEVLKEHLQQVLRAYVDKPKEMQIEMGRDELNSLAEGKFAGRSIRSPKRSRRR